MTRLLLMGCSSSKNPCGGFLSAAERYTGVFYRVVAKAKREGYWPVDLQMAVVSAYYGFLSEKTLIENYNQKLDRNRALALQESVGANLDAFLRQTSCHEVYIVMGQFYRLTLANSQELLQLDQQGCVGWASGKGIGIMQQQLRDWLVSRSRNS